MEQPVSLTNVIFAIVVIGVMGVLLDPVRATAKLVFYAE
jgi:hypothetical protein